MKLTVKTLEKRQVIDITDIVQDQIKIASGIIDLTVLHTTAALTTADLDPGTDEDFLQFLEGITPMVNWRHPHDPQHAPDHMLASLIGPALTVAAEDGRLVLGSWQRIVLVELDGPRERQISLSILPIKE